MIAVPGTGYDLPGCFNLGRYFNDFMPFTQLADKFWTNHRILLISVYNFFGTELDSEPGKKEILQS